MLSQALRLRRLIILQRLSSSTCTSRLLRTLSSARGSISIYSLNARPTSRFNAIQGERTWMHRRILSTPAPFIKESSISIEDYHENADRTMESLLDRLENLLDSAGQPDWEVDYHSGVLNLKLGSHGTYVINKQPPNKQIWLSSPQSGPKRYDFREDMNEWVYARDGRSMHALLSEELSGIFNEPISIRNKL